MRSFPEKAIQDSLGMMLKFRKSRLNRGACKGSKVKIEKGVLSL